MAKFILKRILWFLPVFFAVSLLVYIFLDLAPGNELDMLGTDLSEEQLAELYHERGYDRSVFYRYYLYMKKMLRGDLGRSSVYGEPVLQLYLQRLPATLALAGTAVLFSVLVSVPLGILSAARQNRAADRAIRVGTVLGLAMPNFWLGVLLLLLFSHKWGLLPSGGNLQGLRSLILPALTLGSGLTAALVRTTRGSMLEVMGTDYLKAARAKGLPRMAVLCKHAFKNALIPVLTVLGSQLGAVMGGAAVTESVFSWPGTGRLLVDALKERDAALAAGCLLMTALMISLVQLAVDLLYGAVNPKLRSRRGGEGGGRE